jgi:hypothetical protein
MQTVVECRKRGIDSFLTVSGKLVSEHFDLAGVAELALNISGGEVR